MIVDRMWCVFGFPKQAFFSQKIWSNLDGQELSVRAKVEIVGKIEPAQQLSFGWNLAEALKILKMRTGQMAFYFKKLNEKK